MSTPTRVSKSNIILIVGITWSEKSFQCLAADLTKSRLKCKRLCTINLFASLKEYLSPFKRNSKESWIFTLKVSKLKRLVKLYSYSTISISTYQLVTLYWCTFLEKISCTMINIKNKSCEKCNLDLLIFFLTRFY